MKTPFIPKLILLFILFFLYSAGYAQQRDSVTIRGQVTDYNGQPIDSCSIFWQSPSFDDIKQAITDQELQEIATFFNMTPHQGFLDVD